MNASYKIKTPKKSFLCDSAKLKLKSTFTRMPHLLGGEHHYFYMEFYASLRGQDYRISPGDYQGIKAPKLLQGD
jgi:hypothetical protein